MPLTPPPFVNVAAPIARPYPKQQILWPTLVGHGDDGGSDSGMFPSLTAIKARRAAHPPEALTAFVEAARAAQDRILVLDDFLFEPERAKSRQIPPQIRYDQILAWLPRGLVANEIRFLTNGPGDQGEQHTIRKLFNQRAMVINQSDSRRAGAAKIEIRFSLSSSFPYVHDRFAIIDDELWHFGATVGGFHSLVNAATRGWDAEAHDAVRFFNNAWDGDNDTQRGSHHG